jgi:chitin synthase
LLREWLGMVSRIGKRYKVQIEEIERLQEDVNTKFELVVKHALVLFQDEVPKPDVDMCKEAFMKLYTFLVAVYLFSNFLVYIIVLNDSFQGL